MWLLFHRNAKTRLVKDGHCFIERCPQCGRDARFEEVEQTESYGVFFVDLVGDRERGYRCRECGEVFDLKDEPAAARPAAASSSTTTERPIDAERERERVEQVAQARRDAVEAKANQIEDELAELKKRLGR